jgi:hypothetical protein
VGAKEDEEFVQMMDVIDCLPPGLYEMVISPRPAHVPPGGFVTGDWIARFEARSLDDLRALGRNSPEDDRAFAAVARLSELNLQIYRTFVQPFIRAVVNQPAADLAQALNPLRLSYTIFADSNPWMQGVQALAAGVAAFRQPATADNPFVALQTQVSDQITAALDVYRVARDQLLEQTFFGFYGSPFVQALLGLNDGSEVRSLPGISPQERSARRAQADAYMAKLQTGGFDEALIRAVLYVTAAERMVDQRCALALNVARQQVMHLSLIEFKVMVRDQFFVLHLEGERAVEALASLVPEADARTALLEQVQTIVGAGCPPLAAERERLARLSQVLSVPTDPPVASATSGGPSGTRGRARRSIGRRIRQRG